MFLRATMENGEQVVSEFTSLGRVERYVLQVFNGLKPFNAWKVTGREHPTSGEQVLYRERQMINGRAIVSIEQVEPTTEDHQYDPNNFVPVTMLQKGPLGLFTVPENAEGDLAAVEAGTQFPIHSDPSSLRRYILLKAESEGVEEVRHYLDAERETGYQDSYYDEPRGYDSYDDDDDDDDF